MTRPSYEYLLKAVKANHADSAHLDETTRAIRKAILASVVGTEQVESVLDAFSNLDDAGFSLSVEVLKSQRDAQVKAQQLIESAAPADTTYEILKAKYGGKQ